MRTGMLLLAGVALKGTTSAAFRCFASARASSFSTSAFRGHRGAQSSVAKVTRWTGGASSASSSSACSSSSLAGSKSMMGSGGGPYDFVKECLRFEGAFASKEEAGGEDVVPVTVLSKKSFKKWFSALSETEQAWFKALGQDKFQGGALLMSPGASGLTGSTLAYCLDGKSSSPLSLAPLRAKLPKGKFKLQGVEGDVNPEAAAFAWGLSSYEFSRYKQKKGDKKDGEGDKEGGEGEGGKEGEKQLVWPDGADWDKVATATASTYLVRDLITTPTEDCGPSEVQGVMEALATEFQGGGGGFTAIVGDDLLEQRYPMIHAVGRAVLDGSGREPRLLDLTWGKEEHPKVTLVGKGVCFDTGGLNIKPGGSMLTMKKDMGGAAQVIGLARMIMASNLPIRLRVLVPAVENNIHGNAFRPGDVLVARNGKSTEIGNTDAEGRLVLGDALVEASSEEPELLIDMATLTGAARVALGTDVPVLFSNDEELGDKLVKLSGTVNDQVWRLPLWDGYRKQLKSPLADLKNIGAGGYGGAITAALYLEEFVGKDSKKGEGEEEGDGEENDEGEEEGGSKSGSTKWLHLDFMAFNTESRPGRPSGGEAQGMRAMFALIEDLFP